jgi:hypothetical protein
MFTALQPQILVFTRPETDGGTVAIISLTPLAGPFQADLMGRLMAGVTRWVNSSASGRAALDYSSDDLNIGDLAHDEGDPDLVIALESVGIAEFKVIKIFDGNDCYPYDTLLFDPNVTAPSPE